jgi:hypothetical protein
MALIPKTRRIISRHGFLGFKEMKLAIEETLLPYGIDKNCQEQVYVLSPLNKCFPSENGSDFFRQCNLLRGVTRSNSHNADPQDRAFLTELMRFYRWRYHNE